MVRTGREFFTDLADKAVKFTKDEVISWMGESRKQRPYGQDLLIYVPQDRVHLALQPQGVDAKDYIAILELYPSGRLDRKYLQVAKLYYHAVDLDVEGGKKSYYKIETQTNELVAIFNGITIVSASQNVEMLEGIRREYKDRPIQDYVH